MSASMEVFKKKIYNFIAIFLKRHQKYNNGHIKKSLIILKKMNKNMVSL